ncbi:MAG TPA: hypothetical protein DCL63_05810 [Firmicutes bacterium]|nr:hypothetical protein [Bacillota bacterium]HBK59545.1 hypothetical protein [Bacillota bacterium]
MVAAARHVPSRGHIVWISFDPQRGHEQAGRRPALVLSQSVYNRPFLLEQQVCTSLAAII